MKQLIIILLLLSIGIHIKAQNSFVSLGADATGTGGKVNLSLGQNGYAYSTSSTGSITLGVQQSYIVKLASSIHNADASIMIYPNPTPDEIIIEYPQFNQNRLFSYSLHHISGQKLSEGKVRNAKTIISMREWSSGNYILTLDIDGKSYQTYQIQKN